MSIKWCKKSEKVHHCVNIWSFVSYTRKADRIIIFQLKKNIKILTEKTFENSLNFSLKTKEIFRLRERVHFLVFIKPCPPIQSDNNERENYKVTAASGNRLSRKWIVERTFPKKTKKLKVKWTPVFFILFSIFS